MALEVKSCRRCKQLFKTHDATNICPVCTKKADELFIAVREYLYSNPNAVMEQVCESTGAERADIINWLRQGKLVLSGDAMPLLNCETCGKPILSGRYCETCSERVKSSLKNTAQSFAEKIPDKKKPDDKSKRGTHLDIN